MISAAGYYHGSQFAWSYILDVGSINRLPVGIKFQRAHFYGFGAGVLHKHLPAFLVDYFHGQANLGFFRLWEQHVNGSYHSDAYHNCHQKDAPTICLFMQFYLLLANKKAARWRMSRAIKYIQYSCRKTNPKLYIRSPVFTSSSTSCKSMHTPAPSRYISCCRSE